jgi:uncharacterized protein DUF1326
MAFLGVWAAAMAAMREPRCGRGARRRGGAVGDLSYRVRGAYFESCNCDTICPCRMIGGVPGGRSSYGVCYGVLSWLIEEGNVGDLDLSGFAVALVYHYDDDEEGARWSLVLHVDARGDLPQQAALSELYLGGPHVTRLPWVCKARDLIRVRPSRIEIEGTTVRIGAAVSVRATRAVDTELPVACGVPGYDRVGRELYADELRVDEEPFAWRLEGTCAYATDFDYTSG